MTADTSSERWDASDYPDVDVDLSYESALDNDLHQPGSDGLIEQGGPQMLMELARRREQGASLAELRRSAGQIDPFRVTNATLERAVDQGARLLSWDETGRIKERGQRWHGINVGMCPVCGRRVLVRALRRAGCVLCTEGPS